MVCHISLKNSQQGLQLCFEPHFNWRLAQKVMGFQNIESLNFRNFGAMTFRCRPHGQTQKNTIRGKVVASPNPSCGGFCEFVFAHDSSVHQKCSNYALINLLFGLCKFMWIIDLFIICFSPHPEAPTCLSILEVLRIRECIPIPYPFVIFTFGFVVESIKEFSGVSL